MNKHTTNHSFQRVGWMALVLCLAGGLWAQDESRFGGRRDADSQRATQAVHREGTKMVGQLGYFAEDAGQFVFHYKSEGEEKEHEIRALENLALERVSTELLNNSQAEPPRWSISGTFTEYRGTNFLIIRRAVLKVKK